VVVKSWENLVIQNCMNNTVESDFGFPKVKWLHLIGEMDKSVRFSYIFSGFNISKNDWQKRKRWMFFGTQCICIQAAATRRNMSWREVMCTSYCSCCVQFCYVLSKSAEHQKCYSTIKNGGEIFWSTVYKQLVCSSNGSLCIQLNIHLNNQSVFV